MKIILAIDHFNARKGGAEQSLCRILAALRERGHHVGICAMTWQRPEGADWAYHHVSTPPWPRWWRYWSFARRVDNLLRALAPDVVLGVRHVARADVFLARGGLHCETLDANRRVRPSRPWSRFRYLQPKHQVMLALERRLFLSPAAPRVVSPSDMVRRQCLARFPLQPGGVVVVRTGVNLAMFEPANEATRMRLRERLGLRDRVVGLFVAHNFALKGLPCLLEAWHHVDPERFQLLVAGRGRPPTMARRLPNVTFLGDHANVLELYQAADFLVHPTFYDPFSRVVIEALACGLPVITTRYNGAAEIMQDGREGFILDDPTHFSRLQGCLERLDDDSLRLQMGRRARQSAERHPESRFLQETVMHVEQAAQPRPRKASNRSIDP
jgi:UDP-glucose:(heptosyl)LPS alpha-1,3-glucosyltransferase